MKLSPPASSSDIDIARVLARRLARLGRSGEAPEAPLPVFAPRAAGQAVEAAVPRAAERHLEPPRPAPPSPARPAAPEAQKPPPPVEARRPAAPRPPPAPVEEPLGVVEDEESEGTEESPPEPESDIEIEQDMGGEEPPVPAASGASELDFAGSAAGPKPEPELELVADFEEEKPAPPSWSEILQDCLFLARSRGALLISPAGQVAASCGEWPPPGVDAIAARLVPAMEKALKNAPARSVSVPLGGQHLTAWRVPLSRGLITVGFVADAPLKPEIRPTIDGELKRGDV